jgi:hypothetical protein
MDIKELFEQLDHHQRSFPHDLVAEAITRQDEITLPLLEILEDVDRNPDQWAADQERMIHVFAMYLLALFRETRAYPLLVRIFSRPGEYPFDLVGDVVTQSLGDILASVSGGETGGIVALIENEQAHEYVRSGAMGAMVSLVLTGQRTRDEVMGYFLELFHKLERTPGAQWDGLANSCADLWPHEALDELNRAYEDGLVDTLSIAWEDIERAEALGIEGSLQETARQEPLINNLSWEMGWMMRFHRREPLREQRNEPLLPLPAVDWTPPIRRTEPKIGRNDPCTCGSGKKYKKCCGAD